MPCKLTNKISQHYSGICTAGKFHYTLFLALCFSIAVSKAAAAIILGGLGISSMIFLFSKNNRNLRRPGIITISLILLYLIYTAGMINTSDIRSGLFDLEIKLSFILLPFTLIFSEKNIYSIQRVNTMKLFFVYGALAGTVSNLLHSTLISFQDHFTFDNFMYEKLSWFFHPSYLTMYLNFSIILLSEHLSKSWNQMKLLHKSAYATMILYFIVFIMFLNSKAGILMTALTIFILFLYIIIIKRKFITGVTALVLVCIVSAFVINRTPYITSRFEGFLQSVKPEDGDKQMIDDGTTHRIMAWENSLQLFLKNLPFGVGTGDVRSELNASYLQNNFKAGIDLKLNSHNQFLQTAVAVGILGLLLLLLLFIFLFIQSFRWKSICLILFTIIIFGNFLVESMLETQAGVVFIALFISLYDITGSNMRQKENQESQVF